MSLRVYRSRLELPEQIKYVKCNDVFFNANTDILKCDMTDKILREIDKGSYISTKTFMGRTKEWGALDKSCLSTGSKTLLNILSHKDICFDVCECGSNALSFLTNFTSGVILWETPVVAYAGTKDCDIEYKGKFYTDFYKFQSDVLKGV